MRVFNLFNRYANSQNHRTLHEKLTSLLQMIWAMERPH